MVELSNHYMLGSIIFLQIDFLIVIEKVTFTFYEGLYSMKNSLFAGGHTDVYTFSTDLRPMTEKSVIGRLPLWANDGFFHH